MKIIIKYYLTTEKRWIEHPGVETQYLANISPYQWQLFLKNRIKSASIRHVLPLQRSPLPINTNYILYICYFNLREPLIIPKRIFSHNSN